MATSRLRARAASLDRERPVAPHCNASSNRPSRSGRCRATSPPAPPARVALESGRESPRRGASSGRPMRMSWRRSAYAPASHRRRLDRDLARGATPPRPSPRPRDRPSASLRVESRCRTAARARTRSPPRAAVAEPPGRLPHGPARRRRLIAPPRRRERADLRHLLPQLADLRALARIVGRPDHGAQHRHVGAPVERRQRARGADGVVDDAACRRQRRCRSAPATLDSRSPRHPMRRSSTSADCSPRTCVASQASPYMPVQRRDVAVEQPRRAGERLAPRACGRSPVNARSTRAAALGPQAVAARAGPPAHIARWPAERSVRPPRRPRPRRQRRAAAAPSRRRRAAGSRASAASMSVIDGKRSAGLAARPRSRIFRIQRRHARVVGRLGDRAGDDVRHQRDDVVAGERALAVEPLVERDARTRTGRCARRRRCRRTARAPCTPACPASRPSASA